jgi:hypothetical protein
MKAIITLHKKYWVQQAFILSVASAVILFTASIYFNIAANRYAALTGTQAVTDVVLNNVRVFNVNWVVSYGPLFIIAMVVTLLLVRPTAMPFTIKSIAMFIAIRAVFISVTHLGQFTPQLQLSVNKFLYFTGGGNTGGLFFSGHTGVPFLLAFIFWDDKKLRYLFLLTSVVFGAAMLLAHLHYTIDVLGAFFITPTIFRISQNLFRRDYAYLVRG